MTGQHFASFSLLSIQDHAISGIGTGQRVNADTPLTKAPDKRRQWLRVSLHVPARDANQTRSLLSVARSLSESKSQPWTTTSQSGLCSKTERISHSMLSRSFASLPIFPTGKLTITNASNAGHLCTANNQTRRKAGFLMLCYHLSHVPEMKINSR
jgi:hypothetical protein